MGRRRVTKEPKKQTKGEKEKEEEQWERNRQEIEERKRRDAEEREARRRERPILFKMKGYPDKPEGAEPGSKEWEDYHKAVAETDEANAKTEMRNERRLEKHEEKMTAEKAKNGAHGDAPSNHGSSNTGKVKPEGVPRRISPRLHKSGEEATKPDQLPNKPSSKRFSPDTNEPADGQSPPKRPKKRPLAGPPRPRPTKPAPSTTGPAERTRSKTSMDRETGAGSTAPVGKLTNGNSEPSSTHAPIVADPGEKPDRPGKAPKAEPAKPARPVQAGSTGFGPSKLPIKKTPKRPDTVGTSHDPSNRVENPDRRKATASSSRPGTKGTKEAPIKGAPRPEKTGSKPPKGPKTPAPKGPAKGNDDPSSSSSSSGSSSAGDDPEGPKKSPEDCRRDDYVKACRRWGLRDTGRIPRLQSRLAHYGHYGWRKYGTKILKRMCRQRVLDDTGSDNAMRRRLVRYEKGESYDDIEIDSDWALDPDVDLDGESDAPEVEQLDTPGELTQIEKHQRQLEEAGLYGDVEDTEIDLGVDAGNTVPLNDEAPIVDEGAVPEIGDRDPKLAKPSPGEPKDAANKQPLEAAEIGDEDTAESKSRPVLIAGGAPGDPDNLGHDSDYGKKSPKEKSDKPPQIPPKVSRKESDPEDNDNDAIKPTEHPGQEQSAH